MKLNRNDTPEKAREHRQRYNPLPIGWTWEWWPGGEVGGNPLIPPTGQWGAFNEDEHLPWSFVYVLDGSIHIVNRESAPLSVVTALLGRFMTELQKLAN